MIKSYQIMTFLTVTMLFLGSSSLQATYAVIANYTDRPLVASFVDDGAGLAVNDATIQPGSRFEINSGSNIHIVGIDADQDIILSEYGKEGFRGIDKKKRYLVPVGWVLGWSICPASTHDAKTPCKEPWHD